MREREREGGGREGGRERAAVHARRNTRERTWRVSNLEPVDVIHSEHAAALSQSRHYSHQIFFLQSPSPLHAPGRPAAAWTSLVSACAFCRAHHPAGTAPPAGFSEAAQQREAPLRLPAQPKFNEDGHALAITTTLSLETPAQVGALNLPGARAFASNSLSSAASWFLERAHLPPAAGGASNPLRGRGRGHR